MMIDVVCRTRQPRRVCDDDLARVTVVDFCEDGIDMAGFDLQQVSFAWASFSFLPVSPIEITWRQEA